MQKIYVALCSALMCILSLHSMEMDLSQSTIDLSEEKPTQQRHPIKNEQIISFKEQINNLSKEKQKIYRPVLNVIQSQLESQLTSTKTKVIDYSLKMINNNNIDSIIQEINQQKITLNNKINILSNLYNLPKLLVPFDATKQEWEEVASWKNNKIKLKKELKLKIEQNYKKQDNAIAKKQKENANISVEEWKKYQKALEKYNSIVPENAISKSDIATKLKLVTFMAKPKKEKTIQDLQEYKENLEKYLTHLQASPETQKKYEETIQHIKLINNIDEQLKVDYTNFTILELLDHIELLQTLRKNLQNNFSERYDKLNNKIEEELQYHKQLKEKRDQEERREKEILEQEKLREKEDLMLRLRQEALEQEKHGKKLDIIIKEEEIRQQKESLKRKYEQEREERLAMFRNAAKQYEQELEELEQARLQRKNAKRWIPWITNRLNQARQTAVNFVTNITSTIAAWWLWLTGK